MAELALSAASPIVEMVVKKLASGLWKELALVRSVYTDLENLQSDLSEIKNVLDDAEKKSDTLRGWLKMLREAAFDADDLVDELQTEALRRRMEGHDHMTGKVRDFFSSNNPIAFRYKMARKIKEITERFDKITKKIGDFNLMGKSDSDKPVDRETSSLVVESKIYGRVEDEKVVMNFLGGSDKDKNISILSIVGLGGVGKTALARLVYNNEKIKEKFKLRMWVCVGQNFDVKVILRAMIEQLPNEKSSSSILETMSLLLQEKLREKRFLLVLDDLWNSQESEWERLKPLFLDAQLGSKIIVTTRIETVASAASTIGTVSVHKLQGLQDDDCWTLFKQRAFRSDREEDDAELVKIGRGIIKKCGGLPLAAKALGSLMCTKREKAQWLAIKNNEIWKLSEDKIGILPEDKIGILPALKLSYDHLHPHLKRCFTYCSVFPKDYIFEIKRLIQLWMAEGLIDLSDTSQNAEDIGKQYFHSLLWRSFFQDVQMDTCKMHDLVHDLACSLTKGESESLVMEMGRKIIPHECRYLSVVLDNVSSITSIYEAKKLRSLFLLGKLYYGIDEIFFNITKKITQIRALDLRNSGIQKLSDKMSRLKQLRFLDLSYTEITTLPTSITRLYNLQTLNLQRCDQLQELPEGISNLSNLRHIDISWCDQDYNITYLITRLYNLQELNVQGCRQLRELPEGISNISNLRHMDTSSCYKLPFMPRFLGQLTNLETLGMFIVGWENGRTIAELEHLNSIHGKLEITNLHNVKDAKEATQANLGAKSRLNNLKLQWNRAPEPSSTEVEVAAVVFERLQPHHNLKVLDVSCYMGIRLPIWMARAELASSSFPNPVRLILWSLERCEHVPSLGLLPLLKHLTMGEMHAVKRIEDEFYGDGGGNAFPSLEALCLSDMPNLKEWHTKPMMGSGGRQMAFFPRLSQLWIDSCPELMAQPCIPCFVEDLRIEMSNEMLLSAGSLAGLSKLKELEIRECGVSLSSSSRWWDGLQYLTALEKLQIWGCDELTCLPEGIMYLASLHTLHLDQNRNLRSLEGGGRKQQQQPTPIFPALQDLSISKCPNLATLPDGLQYLTTLQALYIDICPKLVLPDDLGHLTTLQKLRISDLPQLAMLLDGLQNFIALQHLEIYNCPQLTMLPDGLRHLTTLRKLKIYCCPQLARLPDSLQDLTALQMLYIDDCPQLTMLPDGLRHLNALQMLHIYLCPQLARRCKRKTSEDWHKIAHIPDIKIWPEEDEKESSKPSSTFAKKFLGQFGCARYTGHS
ncbi:LOW QUALITY PROTEIN: disease resistance protein RGA2-like [Phoenix dactylifera]|uniref:LOW QUALITY PROTEIN: disease resistance protein RGA2-like n=1 Tax=Phoenix dactylifera TaxID=42345 RepID=A0A8B8ZFS8_PHODC|nr:LOW QUALITY PROTEIN: disease resistance protein RGA2-like [Phoenix dactylifera]